MSRKSSYTAYLKRQFFRNWPARVALYLAIALGVVALLADVLANEMPLYAKYKGETYFPVFRSYAVDMGWDRWPPELLNVTWKDLEYEQVFWPVVPYLHRNQDDANRGNVGPFETQQVRSLRWRHWLGTDYLGRDVLAGLIHGTRVAFLVGVIAMSIAGFIGILLGALAGFWGDEGIRISKIGLVLGILCFFLGCFYAFGVRKYVLLDAMEQSYGAFIVQLFFSLLILILWMGLAWGLTLLLKKVRIFGKPVALPLDILISRFIEIVEGIPVLFLILALIAVMRPSIYLVMVLIGFTSWTSIARFIRAEMLKLRSLEYIESARALGYSRWRIMIKHAIPNALTPVMITIAFGIASAILVESGLSFLGLGEPGESVTWGSLLSDARRSSYAWWMSIFPGCAIFLTVTVFNLIGEGLTDALDPRLKK